MTNDMTREVSFSGAKFFSIIPALILFIVACNKNIDSAANKAYLSVTHISPDASPLDIFFEGNKLNTVPLVYDSTTGVPGDPYLIAIAGVHNFQLTSGSQTFVDGSIALQRTHHYSIFAYDSVDNNKLKTLIVEDQLSPPVDTMSLLRILNFCDTSLYIAMLNLADTISPAIPFRKVQPDSDPSGFVFNKIRSGTYQIFAAADTTITFNLDSLSLSGGKIYTIYITGNTKTTDPGALRRGLIVHN